MDDMQMSPLFLWSMVIGGTLATIAVAALMFAALHEAEPYPSPRELMRKLRKKK